MSIVVRTDLSENRTLSSTLLRHRTEQQVFLANINTQHCTPGRLDPYERTYTDRGGRRLLTK